MSVAVTAYVVEDACHCDIVSNERAKASLLGGAGLSMGEFGAGLLAGAETRRHGGSAAPYN